MNGSEFGKLLLEYRKKNNLTQLELGEKLNVSDKTISRWERGDRVPDSYAIKDISELLNVSTDTLLGIDKENFDNNKDNETKTQQDNTNLKRKNYPVIILIFLLLVIIFLLSFGMYNNYNKFKVYSINSSNKELHVNGQLVLSPIKNILIISEIKNIENEELHDLNLYDYQYEILIDNKKIYQYGDVSSYIYDENSEVVSFDEIVKNINVYLDDIGHFNINKDISILISFLSEDKSLRNFEITLNTNELIANNKLHYK